jgi:hypothetical protein
MKGHAMSECQKKKRDQSENKESIKMSKELACLATELKTEMMKIMYHQLVHL